MKKFVILFLIFFAFCGETSTDKEINDSATTPIETLNVTTESEPELYVMLMWHQHQPFYTKNDDGYYTRPWVRVHATKDYLDMVDLVADYPDMKATFNLTPVLLRQLEDFSNGAKDLYWFYTEINAEDLTEEDKAFIVSRFFDTNPKVIARFPRYVELRNSNQNWSTWTNQDFRDLQILFNLAWTDPKYLSQEPLEDLVSRGRDFTEEDKITLLNKHSELIDRVIPAHAELWKTGQIEITTTPYAHPILPLIFDTNLAAVGDIGAELPTNRFSKPTDAAIQVEKGLDLAEKLLGQRPTGMWPAEGAVSQEVLGMFAKEGIKWIATGEHVLSKSLDIPTFKRNTKGIVTNPEVLYTPWYGQLNRQDDVAIFFRDLSISDQVGFTYSGMSPELAVADMMKALEAAREVSATMDKPLVVSIVLDGENAWEHYQNDGIDFLSLMYETLTTTDWLKTTTPTEYIEKYGPQIEKLDKVFPASWFQPNFATWIGETEETYAWDYLQKTRAFYDRSNASGDYTDEQLEEAFDFMLLAEGSDWFWWYGSDQSSGNDDYFGSAYRNLLKNVYTSLGESPPAYLDIPIISPAAQLFDKPSESILNSNQALLVNGLTNSNIWIDAGVIETSDIISKIQYRFSDEHLYVSIQKSSSSMQESNPWMNTDLDIYIESPSRTKIRRSSVPSKDSVTSIQQFLGIETTQAIFHNGEKLKDGSYFTCTKRDLPNEGSVKEETFSTTCLTKETTEISSSGNELYLKIPLGELGSLSYGDKIKFRFYSDIFKNFIEPSRPLALFVPEVSNVELFLDITDPIKDDHGEGTYTYPVDGVFIPGSYDFEGFSAGIADGSLIMNFDILSAVKNPWGSPRSLSVQTIDVYIDKDFGSNTGVKHLGNYRFAKMPDESGWEYHIVIEGWEPQIWKSLPGGESELVTNQFDIVVVPDKGVIVVKIDIENQLGGGNPEEWHYGIIMMSQDGYGPNGSRIREINSSAEQYRGGGAPNVVNHPNIFDVIFPEGGVQEEFLSSYGDYEGSVDDIPTELLASIPLVSKNS
jgi:alpha-amylase/alpha-mannosidase (GH57 family)